MQLRMKLFKARIRRDRLNAIYGRVSKNLECKKCGTKHLFALYEGDVCQRCYTPRPVDYVPYKPIKEIKDQMAATLALRPVVKGLMEKHNLKRATFARKMGLDPQTLYLWWTDRLGSVGQDRVNQNLYAGIAELFSPQASSPKPQALAPEVPA